jgi:hypothetical protein
MNARKSRAAWLLPPFLDSSRPSMGASTASRPSTAISGNAKKSMSSRMVLSVYCWVTKEPSRYMPDFFLPMLMAASCQVMPRAAGFWYGSSAFQVSKTSLTFFWSQDSLCAVRSKWNL